MPVGPEPVIAVAAGPDAWYCWLAPHLLDRQQPATVRAPDLRSLWVSGEAGRRGKDCRAPSPTLQGGGWRGSVCLCGGGGERTHTSDDADAVDAATPAGGPQREL